MRVVLFIDTLQTGGTQRQIVAIANGLAHRGIDVELLSVYPGGRFWDEALADNSFTTESLYSERPQGKAARVIGFLSGPVRLRRWLRTRNADVIYSMLDVANLMARLALTWLPRRPLLVWGIRASARQAGLRAAIVQTLCRWFSGGIPLAITNSSRGLEAHRQMGFRITSAAVVHNGFDTESFKFDEQGRQRVRQAWGVADDEIVIGLIGRVDPMKGHGDFIAAAAELAAADQRVRFVCVGPGPEHARQDLAALAEERHISERFLIVDGNTDMKQVYSALDIVVSASIAEGFPNVIGEAMACERACVVTDVGDTAALTGECGVVVAPRDSRAMAAAISQAIEKRAELGACGRDRISHSFSLGAMAEKTQQTLERVLVR